VADSSFLAWPFFEDRHRRLAPALDAFAARMHLSHDDTEASCRAAVRALGDAGVLAPCCVLEEGGRFDVRSLALSREVFARHDPLLDFAFAMQGLGTGPISLFGSQQQREGYLPPVMRGERLAAFALSEPQAGSDLAAIATSARREGADWILDGQKTWISNGGIADHYVVFAKTDAGLSAFIVNAGTPGLEVSARIAVIAPHPLASLRFSGCRVRGDALIGNPGQGLRIALGTLEIFRTTVGAAALGLARRALDEALERTCTREISGRKLADYQLTQARLADMALQVDAAALLVYRAAWAKDSAGGRITREAAMAKLYATEAAQQVIDAAVQLFGGAGVVSGGIAERLYREIRALRIYEGTSEIQKLVIAGTLTKERQEAKPPEGFMLDATRIARERLRGVWPQRVATDYLDRWATEKPDATALVAWRLDEEREVRLTWKELATRTAAMAAALENAGVRRGDVVSFQLPSWWEFVALYLACVRLGAIANPLMPIFRKRELSFMLRQAEARVFVAPAKFRGFDHAALARELAAEMPGMRLLIVGGEGADSLELALERADTAKYARGARLQPDDVTQLLYTSGTTGESKGALHTSNTLLCAVQAFAPRMKIGADDVIFMPSPLAHQLGFCYGMLMSLQLGVPLVLSDIWRAARAAQLITDNGVTFTFAATPFLADLAGLVAEKQKLGRLRLFASSGAPIPPAVAQAGHEKLDLAVAASWGMTECGSITVTPPDGSRATESDGSALPNGEVRIVGSDGRELPRGEMGALQVRGASLFCGYLKRPQLYKLDADGWFDTGDLARMDAEGYIRICGRSKDVIIRGGENIPVVEVEAALYRIAEVADAAVVAMPDPRLQERACAFVTLRAGALLDLSAVWRRLAAEGFTKHFWPERLEILAEMPRTATGKIQKFVLRELAKDLRPQDAEAVRAA